MPHPQVVGVILLIDVFKPELGVVKDLDCGTLVYNTVVRGLLSAWIFEGHAFHDAP